MAPEVMCRQNHTYAVDYFAVGVIGYEFMLGRRPYVGKTRKDIRDMMFAKQVYIKKSDIPAGWSIEAADFINKVSKRNEVNQVLVPLKKAGQQAGIAWTWRSEAPYLDEGLRLLESPREEDRRAVQASTISR